MVILCDTSDKPLTDPKLRTVIQVHALETKTKLTSNFVYMSGALHIYRHIVDLFHKEACNLESSCKKGILV